MCVNNRKKVRNSKLLSQVATCTHISRKNKRGSHFEIVQPLSGTTRVRKFTSLPRAFSPRGRTDGTRMVPKGDLMDRGQPRKFPYRRVRDVTWHSRVERHIREFTGARFSLERKKKKKNELSRREERMHVACDVCARSRKLPRAFAEDVSSAGSCETTRDFALRLYTIHMYMQPRLNIVDIYAPTHHVCAYRITYDGFPVSASPIPPIILDVGITTILSCNIVSGLKVSAVAVAVLKSKKLLTNKVDSTWNF